MIRGLLAACLTTLLGVGSAHANALSSHQQLAFDIFKELVEINTVTATGDTARAATASGGFASGSQPVIALPDSQPIPKPTSAASASTKYFHS